MGHLLADVTFEWESNAEGTVSIDEQLWEIDESNAEVDRQHYPDWIEAAIEGARDATSRLDNDIGGRLVLRQVRGMEMDTSPEVITLAATIAAWKAMKGEDLQVGDQPPWVIIWP